MVYPSNGSNLFIFTLLILHQKLLYLVALFLSTPAFLDGKPVPFWGIPVFLSWPGLAGLRLLTPKQMESGFCIYDVYPRYEFQTEASEGLA